MAPELSPYQKIAILQIWDVIRRHQQPIPYQTLEVHMGARGFSGWLDMSLEYLLDQGVVILHESHYRLACRSLLLESGNGGLPPGPS